MYLKSVERKQSDECDQFVRSDAEREHWRITSRRQSQQQDIDWDYYRTDRDLALRVVGASQDTNILIESFSQPKERSI